MGYTMPGKRAWKPPTPAEAMRAVGSMLSSSTVFVHIRSPCLVQGTQGAPSPQCCRMTMVPSCQSAHLVLTIGWQAQERKTEEGKAFANSVPQRSAVLRGNETPSTCCHWVYVTRRTCQDHEYQSLQHWHGVSRHGSVVFAWEPCLPCATLHISSSALAMRDKCNCIVVTFMSTSRR